MLKDVRAKLDAMGSTTQGTPSGHLCEAEAPTEPAGETSNLRGPYGPR